MCTAFVLALFLSQPPSPTIEPKNSVIHNSAGKNRGGSKHIITGSLPPSERQNISPTSTPQAQAAKQQGQTNASDQVYKIDVVTPPPKPQDSPLFPVYLWITGGGVFVNALIWFAILRQTQQNRVAAYAAKRSADMLRHIERPWLLEQEVQIPNNQQSIEGSIVSVDSGVNWSIKAYGKTQAWITEIKSRFDFLKSPDDIRTEATFDETDIERLLGRGRLIVPDSIQSMRTQKSTQGDTAADMKAIFDRQGHWFFYGIIRYRDAFDETFIHETRFAYIYDFVRRKWARFPTPEYDRQT